MASQMIEHPEWMDCLNHLLGWQIGQLTVRELLAELDNPLPKLTVEEVKAELATISLGLVDDPDHGWLLAVPEWDAKLAEVFRGTRWGYRIGDPAPFTVDGDGPMPT